MVSYCRENNISVTDFEKKCNLGNGTIGKWKDGKNNPKVATLIKISDETKIPLMELIRLD